MATEKNISSRIIHKHDIEANWNKAVNFIPKAGEIIIYDKDENYNYERIKIGNGETLIRDLAFTSLSWNNLLDKPDIATKTYVENEIQTELKKIDLSTIEPKEDDIPKVFINGIIPATKDDVLAELTYISRTLTFHSYITIKCQGTSSMKYPKKNFTIKLFEDVERSQKKKIRFKNWGEQNKFCLKANWIDISHARNVVSARLWGDVVKSRSNYNELPELLRTSPNQGAIDGFPIKVYANGVYQGRYTWNIPKDGWMTNMDDELNTHCILCGENYDSGCFRAAALIDGSDWSDELHDTCPDNIKTRWNEAINFVINSTDEEFKANLGNYFDIPSLLDYDLFGLSICGSDSFGKNQIFLTYDGNKLIASMYDLDTTWGMYWNGETLVAADYARTKFEDYVNGRLGNLLYQRLEKLFYAELQSRWVELKAGPMSMINIITHFENFMQSMTSDLIKEDYASTTAGGAYSGIPSVAKNNLPQIRNFALARQSWTDAYVAALPGTVTPPVEPEEPDEPVTPPVGDEEGLVYSLGGAVTFDGTNYIDTGVAPLATDTPFTVLIDWTNTGESAFAGSKHVVMHCMTENAPYPGLILQYNNNGIVSEYRQGSNTISSNSTSALIENADLSRVKVIYRKDAEGNVTVSRCYNENGQIHTNTKYMDYVAVPEELRLGCYRSNINGTGRFAKGVLNDCKIYNYALSDEDINNFLLY